MMLNYFLYSILSISKFNVFKLFCEKSFLNPIICEKIQFCSEPTERVVYVAQKEVGKIFHNRYFSWVCIISSTVTFKFTHYHLPREQADERQTTTNTARSVTQRPPTW